MLHLRSWRIIEGIMNCVSDSFPDVAFGYPVPPERSV